MNTDRIWTGGCLCGRRRYAFEGEPSSVCYCHCGMCRRATGGPFAVLARVETVRWTKERPSVYRSSPIAERGFCPDCGTPLFLKYDDDRRIRLTVGSLDNPDRAEPTSHYGVESRLGWVRSKPALPEEETQETF